MSQLLEWGLATAAMGGQTESGDRGLVEFFPGGVLVAVIDGVGHGGEAAVAAETALRVIQERPSQPINVLLALCHEALKPTRGAVISMASFRAADSTMSWIGVGNVEGVLMRRRPALSQTAARPGEGTAWRPVENVLLMSGLVGFHLPNLHVAVTTVDAGDLLIFATDGIRPDFGRETTPLGVPGWAPNDSPQRIAERICARYNKGTDDALVLVARYLGSRT